MKHSILFTLLCASLVSTTSDAQSVNREKYPDYSSVIRPDFSLLKKDLNSAIARTKSMAEQPLPDHVDNSRYKFFPPVFNQDGGSCGSASRICYMFTHEINAYRNADAQLLSNRYPSHFVWLLTFGNSGKEDFVLDVGVPSAEVYGGTTYSKVFGAQEAHQNDFGWMQGYDKWYSGMWNRMASTGNFPISVETEEGRQAVKRWLFNHNGDNDFQCGGIVGIGVASGGVWNKIPKSPTNDEIGVTQKYYVAEWGEQVDHALTIVGYDDRIEFDLNNNGIIGEKSANEKGAWIVVNSWGNWCNAGFIYCPYAHAVPAFDKHKPVSGFWQPEIYKVRKNYRPLRTIKIKMDYSRRSELYLSAGISSDLNAEMPEKSIAFNHFKFAGDGKDGKTNPAPEIPMLGRWADGKLHKEPMEFGYDLTDLSASFDKNMPLKYFFIVETRDWAAGKGKIYNASIIDYEFQKNGIETPFDINAQGVEIKNQGNKTIISTIVYGENYYAPQNLTLNGKMLSWDAPLKSAHTLKSYKVYRNGQLLDEIPATEKSYTLSQEMMNVTYDLSAVYADEVESSKIHVNTPIIVTPINKMVNFKQSGFAIPNVFLTKYDAATIEYWIKPNAIQDWNQSVGPGWGTFMIHANKDGSITAGWDTQNRCQTPGNAIAVNRWNHIAITVDKNTLKIYTDGVLRKSITSDKYSGLGGFGDLIFNPNDQKNNTDARIDELRIWNYAKSADEIKANYRVQYSGNVFPNSLLAYYKGETVELNGKTFLRDCAHNNQAEILNSRFAESTDNTLKFNDPKGNPSVEIISPVKEVIQGLPTKFTAKYSDVINNLVWTAEGAGVNQLQSVSADLTFKNTGVQTVKVVGSDANGNTVEASCTVNVVAAPAPDANFTIQASKISAGENITFTANHPMMGYIYEWTMPGAVVNSCNTVNATTKYDNKGDFEVTLKVISPDGRTATKNQKISVIEVAPVADFDITPAIIVKGETTFLKDKSKYNPSSWQWFLSSSANDIIVNGQNSSLTLQDAGVYDVALTAKNNSGSNKIEKKRALIICNADSKNGLNFNGGHIELEKNPLEASNRQATFEWWMNPRTMVTFCNGFGDEDNFEIKVSGAGAIVVTSGEKSTSSHDNMVIRGEWHHYAVSINSGNISFFRDGEFINSSNLGKSTFPTIKKFMISLNKAPMDCQIDEFRIWNKCLYKPDVQKYANAPIEDIKNAVSKDKLSVYYNFNQSSGNLVDLTEHQNNGIRMGFGPEGDAWGLSTGVFCLNFNAGASTQDITSQYLKNYKTAFACDGNKVINPKGGTRFAAIADWTLENAVVTDTMTTSVHVDRQKMNCFTFTSGWDSFASMSDHKAYQTFTLPAGCYEFVANYGSQESSCGNSYIAVAAGKGLPNTSDMATAIGSKEMLPGNLTKSNSVKFVLSEETEVSVGLVINISGKACCTINDFQLLKINAKEITADGANGYDLTVDATGYGSLFLPYPTTVPENVTAYVAQKIEGDQVVLMPLVDNVIPANTGVVIKANAGEYHFAPSLVSVAANSLLTGVLEETAVDSDKRYFTLDAQKEPGFYLYNASSLEANRAYLVTSSSDTHESYKLNFLPVGIEQVEGEAVPSKVYDLSGRRVNEPVKGLYIVNGKKVLVK